MTEEHEQFELGGMTLRRDPLGRLWYETLFFRWNRWPRSQREQLTWEEVLKRCQEAPSTNSLRDLWNRRPKKEL